MLTGRSVVLVTVCVAMASLLMVTLSLTSRDEQELLANNSFGVLGHGHRGLYEIIEELGIEVERSISPPNERLSDRQTLLFLGPSRHLVEAEPAHLVDVFEWLKAGGTVVFAPENPDSINWFRREVDRQAKRDRYKKSDAVKRRSFWELMEIDSVNIARFKLEESEDNSSVKLQRISPRKNNRDPSFEDALDSVLDPTKRRVSVLPVRAAGDWLARGFTDASIAIPQDGIRLLEANVEWTGEASGSLVVGVDSGPDEYWLSASFPIGAGRLIAFSDPVLAENFLIDKQDNAMMMMAAIAPDDRQVIIDEFYHGLVSRGNPLMLLGRPGFTLLLSLVFAMSMIYVWRHCQRLGPPLAVADSRRRSLSEYIDAMARLFVKGRDRNAFLVRENREGLDWALRQELNLSPNTRLSNEIYMRLTRRDPKRAQEYRSCVDRLNQLQNEVSPKDKEVLEAMRELQKCL